MDLVSFKKRYMPSKKEIKKLKEDILQRKPEAKFASEDYTRIAIRQKWAKVKKEDLPMIYKDIATSIIDDINGFCTVENVEFGDCYFVFYKGDNSVVHFKIKELKGWKFGMWFSKEKDNTIKCEWFCQYELWLDKFKPSRSEIHCDSFWVVSDYVEGVLLDGDSWAGYEIYQNIRFMLSNPYLAIYRDYFDEDLNLKYVSKRYAKRRAKKAIKECKRQDKAEESLQQKMKNKVIKALRKNFDNIINIQTIDMNVDGCICSPRFQLEITTKDSYPEMCSDFRDAIDDTQDALNHKKKFDRHRVRSVVDSDVKLFTITPFGKKPQQE